MNPATAEASTSSVERSDTVQYPGSYSLNTAATSPPLVVRTTSTTASTSSWPTSAMSS